MRPDYQRYLSELESNWLEVILVPSADSECAMRGGMVRAVQSENTEWYQAFCGEHESTGKAARRRRKFQTKIKRAHTVRALRELITGRAATFYAQELQKFLQRWAALERRAERQAQKEWTQYNSEAESAYVN